MCGFQRGTIECRGDGYLWDADSDGYDPNDVTHPCPACNTAEYLAGAKEQAESTSYGSAHYGGYREEWTGETIWMAALAEARRANAEAARQLELQLCPVLALTPTGTVIIPVASI